VERKNGGEVKYGYIIRIKYHSSAGSRPDWRSVFDMAIKKEIN